MGFPFSFTLQRYKKVLTFAIGKSLLCGREIPIVSIHFCPMPAAHLACLPTMPPPSPPTPPHAPGGLDMYLTGCSLAAGYGGAGAAMFAPLPTAPCAVLVGCPWAMWRAGYGGAGAAVFAPLPTAPCAVLVGCSLGVRWVLAVYLAWGLAHHGGFSGGGA